MLIELLTRAGHNGRAQRCCHSISRAQTANCTGPIEDPLIGGDELVAPQCSRNNQAVGRIRMEIDKAGGSDSDLSVNGNFHDTVLKECLTP